MTKNHQNLGFILNPLYWPIWLILGLMWLATRLPYQLQLGLGRQLGRMLYFFPSKMKTVSRTNIQLCFPELSVQAQKSLLKKNFENLGIGLFETAMAWWLPQQKLAALLELKGLEHCDQASAQGKGIILLSPHFACLEMIGRLIALKHPFTAIYRPHKKKFINYLLRRFRSKYQVTYIARHQMRLVMTSLQNNQPLWLAYDIDAGKKRSVFAPFFGIPTASLTSVSRLAKLTGAAIIPIQFHRRDDNQGYTIKFFPALSKVPTSDLIADATELNKALEKAIREKPEQYLWQYKRFKTRPDGAERLY